MPVVPGSEGIVTTVQAAKRLATRIGYPVLIKAVYGGGGKGIRVVKEADEFADAFRQIRAEAKSAFGNSDVYLEKYVTSMRHVEVQILRDRHGNTRILGLRDCTVQRNNQKLIEESGSTMLPARLEAAICTYAEKIADEINYFGAGTVEFIFDILNQSVYFMEMNTRLQVEHPVTEMVTGIDIVGAQFTIASGGSIEKMAVTQNGYAIEVRVNAETVAVDSEGSVVLKPAPGTVTNCYFPDSEGVSVITCIGPGKTIPPFYDNMIAQIICKGRDRENTINRLLQYLDGVQIRGVPTNIPLQKLVLKDDVFRQGDYDTTYLPSLLDRIDTHVLTSDRSSGAAATDVVDAAAISIEGTRELKVLSPSTGVFYLTPSPTEPEMVSVSDVIDVEKKLCMLEAMKLFTSLNLRSFNRDEAELYPEKKKYRVVRIVPSTGQVVNAGDLLFVVEPV